MKTQEKYMQKAITLALKNLKKNCGGPFGAVIVKNGKIIAEGANQVTSTNDPTAHAEVVAIRAACQKLKTFDLTGCEIYSSCEPCPMCLAAIYWAHLDGVYFAGTKTDAAKIGFDDAFIYRELDRSLSKRKLKMKQIMRKQALGVFQKWEEKVDKILY